jgi:predicted Zn-dependent protease
MTRLLVVCAGIITCLQLHAQDDVTMRAMRDEMQRSMKSLRLEGSEPPYFISYKIVDADSRSASASFGSLIASGETHARTLSVVVRVGSYQFDNTGSTGTANMQTLLSTLAAAGNSVLPIDDNYDEMRRKIWLATDTAYKKAVQDLSAKKAAQQNRNREESTPDFAEEPARQESEKLPVIDLKLDDEERIVREASAVFRTVPMAESSTIIMEVENSTERFRNSEGTSFVRQVPIVSFRVNASVQHPNTGETFSDSYSAFGRSMDELPSDVELMRKTKLVAERLTAREKGKVVKRYNGPVLLEGDAAAQLFAHSFGNQLAARVRTGGNLEAGLIALLMPSVQMGNATASLTNKIGSRVLPDFLSVEDNPQLKEVDGHGLLGTYSFDEEGVPSRDTLLVKEGILQTLLCSRTPTRDVPKSTGSMREHGISPGNLLVNASKTAGGDELRKQLLDLIKQRNLEFGYIIRRLSGETATEAVRIFPDGHEELVRDARVAEITVNSFKDILSVSKERTVLTEHAGPAATGDLTTYIVPDLLFEDMTVEHIPNNSPKLPVLASPLAGN